uniref:Uncharacterized protein n=1 Tax=Scleropages formosus TaxID=113540 RepID=A0A8C9SQK2_SCLFO
LVAKNVLTAYTRQSVTSFNAAALDTAVKALHLQNCNVVVSDLYVTKFKASATAEDITGTLKNPQDFRYGEESLLQQKVKEADEGIFKDKKAMLSFTTGSFESMRRPDGISGISVTLWPLQNGILRYPGPTDTLGSCCLDHWLLLDWGGGWGGGCWWLLPSE